MGASDPVQEAGLSSGNAGQAQSTSGTQTGNINQYMQYLPAVSQATNNAATQAQIQAQPALDALNQQELSTYALPAAQVGQNVAASNAQAGAASNLALLNGTGGQAASAGQALNQQLNPNYYQPLSAAAKGATSALGAINLTGLSPGESNATERSLNQSNVGTGNLGLLNPTNTIANAMNFGGAFNSKIPLMENAVNTATGVAGTAASNAGYSPTGTALGTSQTNQGTSFTTPQIGTTTSPTATSSGISNALLGSLTSTANTNLQPLATSSYQNSQFNVDSTRANTMAQACCFIFLEAMNGSLPPHVRACRDYFYECEPSVARGYKKMANWLVPLMKRFSMVKWIINMTMVKPITQYGGWLKGVNTTGHRYYTIKSFWFNIWRNL